MRNSILCLAGGGLAIFLAAAPALAQPTANTLGGVTFNELLIDPTGAVSFDTDGDGTPVNDDEFVELANIGGSAADISGWEIWDDTFGGLYFKFPGAPGSMTTVLGAGNRAVVVTRVQPGGSAPAVSGGDLSFDAALATFMEFGRLDNGGENLALYDPASDTYIQIAFNGAAEVDFPTAMTGDPAMPLGFSGTATRVGAFEAWGNDQDGCALGRQSDGDIAVVDFCAASGDVVQATPGAANVLAPASAETWTAFE